MKTVVIGGGCFWCIEAVFQRVKGVEKAVSGYAGGNTPNPSYHNHEQHAEVVEVTYDPDVVTFEKLLEIFFGVHDPTTFNQPGTADVGPAYRSIILCTKEELPRAQKALQEAQKVWERPIITELKVLDTFYPAEDYHQNFYNQNPEVGYCQVIINPKLAKFQKKFHEFIKPA